MAESTTSTRNPANQGFHQLQITSKQILISYEQSEIDTNKKFN